MARFRPIAPKPVPAPSDRRLRGAPSSYPYPLFLRASPWTWSSLDREAESASSIPVDLRKRKVIAPRPARPVRTTICVDTSSVTGANSVNLASSSRMTVEQVVAEMERDALPAVISAPCNHVLRANDGQPVCPWLDSLPGESASASRWINGEVVLDVRRFLIFNSAEPTRATAGGTFSCNSRITWERSGTLASVAAPCDVMRFDCSSGGNGGGHLFLWRFDTTRASVFYCPAYDQRGSKTCMFPWRMP